MQPVLLILDANVLIDFCRTDLNLLALTSRHVGKVYVASPVLQRVRQLSSEDADRLGIGVVEPELDLAAAAATRAQTGPLAFDDWLCLLLAEERGWTCVTNDVRLRRECETIGVGVLWGLELLKKLVRKGALTRTAAIESAWAIHRTNPRFITEKLVHIFIAKLSRSKRT